MTPYVLKDPEGTIFAEGVLLSSGKCFISFTKDDFTFMYKTLNEMMTVHRCHDVNKIDYLTIVEN